MHKIKSMGKCLGVLALLGVPSLSWAENPRYIVKFTPGKAGQVKQSLGALGGDIALELKRQHAVAVRLPEQALQGLSHNPNIEYIEADEKREYMLQTTPYALPMLQADRVSDALASNMTLCIMDTGFDINHEDFAGVRVTGSSDPEAGDWWQDPQGHGSYMSGAAIAMNNDLGVKGALPNGQLNLHFHRMPDGVWSSAVTYGIEQCLAAGANVISMSFAGSASKTEQAAMADAYNGGVLLFASSGNGGDTKRLYPASYEEVISIGAVDQDKQHASYSNRTGQVELVAPGSYVLGVAAQGTGRLAKVSSVAGSYEAMPTLLAPDAAATGTLTDCGNAKKLCEGAEGKICLINTAKTDATKGVQNCQSGGGVGALIYNDSQNVFAGNAKVQPDAVSIPVANISDATAQGLAGQLSLTLTMENYPDNYTRAYGTSISSPLAAGVAALVWSHHPGCSNLDIRAALAATAEDLGVVGRDDSYGFGLVQAEAAKHYLDSGCEGTPLVLP